MEEETKGPPATEDDTERMNMRIKWTALALMEMHREWSEQEAMEEAVRELRKGGGL